FLRQMRIQKESNREPTHARPFARRANQFVLSESMSSPPRKNICLPVFGNVWFSPTVSPRQEGRTRRHERRARDAMDVAASVRRMMPRGTAKSGGTDPPTVGSSFAGDDQRSDGG